MGKVVYSPGIQYVQGSLAKPKKVDGHNHGDYLIGTHRTAPTTSNDCTRMYIRKADTYVRSTPPTSNELWARTRFTEVSQAVALRKKDLNSVNADNQAFLAQKDQPGGKKTMFAYLWSICAANYDTAHPRS